MTDIIAIANEKGGVGKTTTSLSLGGALKEAGAEVLLIDLDAQGNLSLAVGLQPSRLRRSIADVLLNSAPVISTTCPTSVPGMDILPANAEMGMAERFIPIRHDYTTLLRRALAEITLYDYIIIDCPPSLGVVTLNALFAADRLIIPTQAEYFSAYALRDMVRMITRVQNQGNPGLEYHILITLFDVRNRIHREIRTQIYDRFGEQVFRTLIQVDTKLRESVVAGLPVTLFAKNSRSAHQYRALAQEIREDVKETSP
jgi:chromosome partitioning protein